MGIQWSLVLFTLLGGVGAGAFFFAGIDELRRKRTPAAFATCICVLVLLVVGGICSVTHLGHPLRAFPILWNPKDGIFLEALLLGLLAVTLIVYMVMLKGNKGSTACKVCAVLGMIFAVLLAFMSAHSYMMDARPAWNTILLPITYLVSAFGGGASLYLMLVAIKKGDEEQRKIASIYTLATGALTLIFSIAYAAFIGIIGNGEFAWVVWGLMVVCGGIIPIICGFLAMRSSKNTLVFAIISLIGATLGALGIRVLMWLVINVDVSAIVAL